MQLRSLIRTWLEQNPQVWRYLGCASAVVGLVCFALSSYCNILFTHWNLIKIVLYSVIGVGICVVVWFPKASREGSTNSRFQAYVEASAGIMGSIISIIIDKVVNKKPNGYGPTSCAAFAVMSFSLARQTHYGFEVEMLNFFLGTLIVQLALIKWWFCFAGIGFYYFLTILRSFLDDAPYDENVGLQDQRSSSIDIYILEKFMSTLIQVENFLKIGDIALKSSVRKYLIGQIGYRILLELRGDSNFLVDHLIHSDAIDMLKEVIEDMIGVGLENQCLDEYCTMRRNNFRWQWRSYLEKVSISKDNYENEMMIKNWIEFSAVCMIVLFPNERKLCDRVFSDFPSLSDISFKKVCSEVTSYILGFAKVWAGRSTLPEELPMYVEVLETLHDLIPAFESVFSDECSAPLRTEVITTRNALAIATVNCDFKGLEDMIRHDAEQESVAGGIHPITVKVMNGLLDVLKGTTYRKVHRVIIEELFSSVSDRMARIIELLENHLENRSKTFPNDTLGYVFLMNNQRYIERKARNSQLRNRYEWIRQQTAKVRQHLELYQRSSWDKVLDILKLDNNEELNVTAESMIEKLGLFKTHFREIWNVQSAWFVNDDKLRKEIRDSVRKILLPAYAPFYSRLLNVLGKDADKKNIRIHSISEIGNIVNDLFDGRES